MARYLLRRLAASVVVLFGVSVLIFGVARVIPGDPARIALGPMASEEQVAQLRAQLYLDRPLVAQYARFLRGLAEGDLGTSTYTSRPVMTDLRQFLPATIELVAAASLIMILAGIPLGVLAGHFRDRWPDHAGRLVALLGVVTPSFVWAIFLVLLFSYALDLMPVIGRLSESIVPPREAVVQIAVDEAKPQRADASVGYGTSEQVRVEAQWRHLNFLGGARTLSVYGTWSAIDRGIDVGFEQPFFPLPALTLFAQVQRWWTDGPAFDADTTSGAAGVTGRWGAQASWSASLS